MVNLRLNQPHPHSVLHLRVNLKCISLIWREEARGTVGVSSSSSTGVHHAHLHSVYKNAMRGGRKLASRAALLLLAVFISVHLSSLILPRLSVRDSNSSGAMSGQQALQTLKALSPVQQRRAAAILGALLADVASESVFQKLMTA